MKMADFFKLYDAIIASVKNYIYAEKLYLGSRWALAECCGNAGIAMATNGNTIAPMFPSIGSHVNLREFSSAIKSWNLEEASLALAACNAYFNTNERMLSLNAYEPYENYCTRGLDMSGAKLALIGHLTVTEEMQKKADEIFILEREPKEGDYPDSACDYILPQCDIVIMTGSTIINKTLPHLLELSANASTRILVGPSVPMCPALLDYGIDRLSGMVVSDPVEMRKQVISGAFASPYPHGTTFMLKK